MLQQRVVTDYEAGQMLQKALIDGVKYTITPSQDILEYFGQKLIFTVLRAKNCVLVEYVA